MCSTPLIIQEIQGTFKAPDPPNDTMTLSPKAGTREGVEGSHPPVLREEP